MTGRLPFTLAPLDGEPFGLWLHAYAARLAMNPGHLAEALGMPARQDHGTGATVPDGSSAAQLAAICASAGLALPAVTAMLAAEPSAPATLMLAWAPQRTTRFCPACLAEDPGEMPAAWSPDQLWPDWAVRLTDDPASSSHDKFLPAALIALLLPHSGTPLNQVTAMVSGQLRRHITGYHMSKLTGSALRILTELALAIDDRGIPIDYRRRRDLAASATLIDDAAWARMTREAGMRLAPRGQRPPLPLRAAHRLRPEHSPAALPAQPRITGQLQRLRPRHPRQPGHRAGRPRPPPARRMGNRRRAPALAAAR
jgi:hypothetical protein